MLVFILMIANAMATSLDERAHMLLNTKNPKVLKVKSAILSEHKKMQVMCDFELAHDLIPRSCYKLNPNKQRLEAIDQACERFSHKMKEVVDVSGLSQKCATLVTKKNQDIQYSQMEANPENFVR